MKRIIFATILLLSVMAASGRTDSINNISRQLQQFILDKETYVFARTIN